MSWTRMSRDSLVRWSWWDDRKACVRGLIGRESVVGVRLIAIAACIGEWYEYLAGLVWFSYGSRRRSGFVHCRE